MSSLSGFEMSSLSGFEMSSLSGCQIQVDTEVNTVVRERV
jgi:hypothetical protein